MTWAGEDTTRLTLHYNRPAEYFEEALVIGNGTMGAIVYGGTERDVISLNDLTLWTGEPELIPCTPYGVIKLLDHYNIPIEGKSAVVVGRSNLVGKPLAQLLLDRNATVTICHSRTRDLGEVTSRADIVCVAIGKAKFLKADMVKEGAVVIDVGMDRDENGKLCGDVDYAEVAPKCSYITPVPGGVGPMTVTMLLQNTVKAYRLQHGID